MVDRFPEPDFIETPRHREKGQMSWYDIRKEAERRAKEQEIKENEHKN